MALWPVILNDQTFNLSDFSGTAYVSGIVNSVEQLIRNTLRASSIVSSNTQAIGTGAKSFTGVTGGLFAVNDYIIAYSSAGNWMMGKVTAYNSVTGAMSVTMDRSVGAGTTTMRISKMGEVDLNASNMAPLEPLLGGTGSGGVFTRAGAASSSNQFGSSFGGVGASLWDAMVEVYEEFVAFDTPTIMTGTGQTPDHWLASPWYMTNVNLQSNTEALPSLPTNSSGDSSPFFGYVSFSIKDINQNSAVMTYGQNGYIAAGGGAIFFEALVFMIPLSSAANNPVNRIGLRGQGSGFAQNIFSYSGIGFECSIINGVYRYVAFIGVSGNVYRQTLPIIASQSQYDRLGFTVSADGNLVRFYVNGNLLLEKVMDIVSNKIQNLMHPAMEAFSAGPVSIGQFYICDSIWVRKNLSR